MNIRLVIIATISDQFEILPSKFKPESLYFFIGVGLKVIRILEGDAYLDTSRSSTPGHDIGSESGRIYLDHHPKQRNEPLTGQLINKKLEGFSRKLSLDAKRSVFQGRDKARRSSFE